MKYLISITLVAIFLQGCATSYQSGGFTGGYSETQLDENVFRVSFRGNAYTGRERVADFTLLRSAELALQHGYKYFSIVAANEYTTNSTYTTPTTSNTTASVYGGSGNYAYGNATTTTYGGQTYNISKPSSSNTIICFNEKPINTFSYNAEFIYKNIAQKYGIKKSSNSPLVGENGLSKAELFAARINALAKEVQADPNYKRIPLDKKEDQEWFASEAFLYWDEKSTKEEFINNGVKKFPGYQESFEYIAEKLKKQ